MYKTIFTKYWIRLSIFYRWINFLGEWAHILLLYLALDYRFVNCWTLQFMLNSESMLLSILLLKCLQNEIASENVLFAIKTCEEVEIGHQIVGHLPNGISSLTRFLLDRSVVVTSNLSNTNYSRSPLVQRRLHWTENCGFGHIYWRNP